MSSSSRPEQGRDPAVSVHVGADDTGKGTFEVRRGEFVKLAGKIKRLLEFYQRGGYKQAGRHIQHSERLGRYRDGG